MNRILAKLLLVVALAGTASAEIVVRIGPPRSVVQRRPPAPGRGYVWIPGYQNWNGRSHEWTQGRWEQPPRRNAHWERHRWQKRNGGWVLVEGRWR